MVKRGREEYSSSDPRIQQVLNRLPPKARKDVRSLRVLPMVLRLGA